MRKIEQTANDMVEIYQKVIYPGLGCAAMVELQVQSLEILRDGLMSESPNKELNKVLIHETNRVIKNLSIVKDTLNMTMEEALIGFAPVDFMAELQTKSKQTNGKDIRPCT